VIHIGRQRKVARPDCLPVSGGWDLLWKVLVQARRAQVVHIHAGFDNTVSRVLAVVCWVLSGCAGRRRSTVVTIHSGKAGEYFRSLRGPRRWFFRNLFRSTPVVIPVNAAIRQALEELVGDSERRFPVIPAFSMDQSFLEAEIPSALADRIEAANPFITCAIFLEPSYGAEDVLELSHRLKDDYPRHLIVLMGMGKQEHLIREKRDALELANHVLLAGDLAQEVCLQMISRSRLFLRPSYVDGDSNSVREALALGVPVVATRTAFRPEGVLLYPPGDVTALEKTVRTVLETAHRPSLADRQAQAASWDENLRRIREIYTKILDEGLAQEPICGHCG